MELVSPAGNLEKLKYAYLFGADAAYIGIKNFSLRARADNFYLDEYKYIKRIKGKKKLYAALNIYFHDADIKALEANLDYISRYPLDAFIISDIGILPIIKKYFKDIPLHLSTQANCLNIPAARFYGDMGFSRIILGRELHLQEIEAIKSKVDIELEVFVHGAMCLAYSGRCFLSSYMAGRQANKGDCAHPCRWQYRVLEEGERPGEYFPILEGNDFSTLLSSRDLCMINHLKELKQAGVDALKIEGRIKSLYYTAIVTRAYAKALAVLERGLEQDIQKYIDEIGNVSHREFSTGFYFGKEEIEKPTDKSYLSDYIFLGTVEKKIANQTFKLDVKNQIKTDQTIEYIGFDSDVIKDKTYALMDEDMKPVGKADHGKLIYLRTDKKIKPGYIIRSKIKASHSL